GEGGSGGGIRRGLGREKKGAEDPGRGQRRGARVGPAPLESILATTGQSRREAARRAHDIGWSTPAFTANPATILQPDSRSPLSLESVTSLKLAHVVFKLELIRIGYQGFAFRCHDLNRPIGIDIDIVAGVDEHLQRIAAKRWLIAVVRLLLVVR